MTNICDSEGAALAVPFCRESNPHHSHPQSQFAKLVFWDITAQTYPGEGPDRWARNRAPHALYAERVWDEILRETRTGRGRLVHYDPVDYGAVCADSAAGLVSGPAGGARVERRCAPVAKLSGRESPAVLGASVARLHDRSTDFVAHWRFRLVRGQEGSGQGVAACPDEGHRK
jgi:hypothetical protein